MSGWRALVMDLVHHPEEAVNPRYSHGKGAVDTAMQLGLIRRITRGLYAPTDLGRDFAAGRVTIVERTGASTRGGRQGRFFSATWLRALPDGVRMDLRPPRAATSEWGGLPS